MRSSDFVVFILWLLLRGESSLASGDQEMHLSQEVKIAEQCSGYCFSVIKPSMDHFNQLKEAVEANNEMKDKINLLENQLKWKDELITDKVDQIQYLREFSKLNNENSVNQREQYEAKIKSLEAEIIQNLGKLNATIEENEVKGSRIMDLETQIEEYQRQLNTKSEDNKALTEKINVLEREANNSREESISRTKEMEGKQAKIMGQETEIKHCQKDKDDLVKSFESTIRDKDSQIKNLTSQTELLRGTREASSCLPFVNSTDIHSIRLPGMDPFVVPCNSSVSGSGWTVIQRRVNGNVDFNRTWTDYKEGFGDLRENFFLGIEKIHQMTLAQPHELYIQLGMVNGSTSYAHYDDFKIGSEEEDYELKSVGQYSGTAGDSLEYHLNMKFTTFDMDNDTKKDGNCAKGDRGGWWFRDCANSILNGKYYKDGRKSKSQLGIHWVSWHNYDWTISLTFSQMMIRATL